jgi:hypothetical protein
VWKCVKREKEKEKVNEMLRIGYNLIEKIERIVIDV